MIQRSHIDRPPADVGRSWARIEAWLRANRPGAVEALREGASEERIGWFQRHTGRTAPAGVRELWSLHDGQTVDMKTGPTAPGVFLDVAMLPLLDPSLRSGLVVWRERSIRERERVEAGGAADAWSSLPSGAVRPVGWSPGWLPLGLDPRGNLLVVDLDPGPNGRSGQVVAFNDGDPVRYVLAASWAHFLEDVADELEAGALAPARGAGASPPTGVIGRLKGLFQRTTAATSPAPAEAGLLERGREWSQAKLTPVAAQAAPAPAEGEPIPVLTGPVADECVRVVRGFIEAMYAYDRHWLALRPLRPFGYSSIGEQFNGESYYICGSSGISDYGRGRPEADLVRRMRHDSFSDEPLQGDELEEEEVNRVLRVGEYFEEGIRRKRAVYEAFWAAMPGDEAGYFHYADPSKFTPECNRVAEVRQVARDHVVVLMEPETEAGRPADRGYHLKLAGDRWVIDRAVLPSEAVCRLVKRRPVEYDEDARDAANHPTPEAIARARELFSVLDEIAQPKPPPAPGESLTDWLEKHGAYVDIDEDGVCRSVSLARTLIHDGDMPQLAPLTGLHDLTLGPKITDAGMAVLEGMTELTELTFQDGLRVPQITGAGLAHLHGMTRLTRLDLSLVPVTDAGLAHLRGPENVQEVRLYKTKVTDAGLVHLRALPNLEDLDLRDTAVAGPGLADLAPLKRLHTLDLEASQITDTGLVYLTGLTSLRDLSLGRTRVTDAGLETLARMTWLESLSLFDTDVTDTGLARLRAALPKCDIN